jgi:hypothetical protein
VYDCAASASFPCSRSASPSVKLPSASAPTSCRYRRAWISASAWFCSPRCAPALREVHQGRVGKQLLRLLRVLENLVPVFVVGLQDRAVQVPHGCQLAGQGARPVRGVECPAHGIEVLGDEGLHRAVEFSHGGEDLPSLLLGGRHAEVHHFRGAHPKEQHLGVVDPPLIAAGSEPPAVFHADVPREAMHGVHDHVVGSPQAFEAAHFHAGIGGQFAVGVEVANEFGRSGDKLPLDQGALPRGKTQPLAGFAHQPWHVEVLPFRQIGRLEQRRERSLDGRPQVFGGAAVRILECLGCGGQSGFRLAPGLLFALLALIGQINGDANAHRDQHDHRAERQPGEQAPRRFGRGIRVRGIGIPVGRIPRHA